MFLREDIFDIDPSQPPPNLSSSPPPAPNPPLRLPTKPGKNGSLDKESDITSTHVQGQNPVLAVGLSMKEKLEAERQRQLDRIKQSNSPPQERARPVFVDDPFGGWQEQGPPAAPPPGSSPSPPPREFEVTLEDSHKASILEKTSTIPHFLKSEHEVPRPSYLSHQASQGTEVEPEPLGRERVVQGEMNDFEQENVPSPKSSSEASSGERRAKLEAVLKEQGLSGVFDPSQLAAGGRGGRDEPAIEITHEVMQGQLPGQSPDELIARLLPCSPEMKSFLMSPAPKGVMMECTIVRERSGLNRFYPKYTFNTDKGTFLMAAKKKVKNKTSHYIVSCDPRANDKKSPAFLGKVRSNFLGSEFTGFGPGQNPTHLDPNLPAHLRGEVLRTEEVAILYSSTLFKKTPKGPRRMTVVIPKVMPSGEKHICRPSRPEFESLVSLAKPLLPPDLSEQSLAALRPPTMNPQMAPQLHGQAMQQHFQSLGSSSAIDIFLNKPPRWNENIGAFVLNFNKRVTHASVKNFQLIHVDDPDTIYLQMVRAGSNEFSLDFTFPFTPFQAFSLCLSNFDHKLCTY